MTALLPSDDEVKAALLANRAVRLAASSKAKPDPDYPFSDSEREAMRAALIAAWNRRTAPVGDGEPDHDWELELRAFNAADNTDLPADVRTLIANLWREYCLADDRTAPSLPTQEDVARVIREMEPHVRKIERAAIINNEMGRVVSGQTEAATEIARLYAAILALMGQTGDGWLKEFASKQERLGPPFEEILFDNLEDLYETDAPAPPAKEGR